MNAWLVRATIAILLLNADAKMTARAIYFTMKRKIFWSAVRAELFVKKISYHTNTSAAVVVLAICALCLVVVTKALKVFTVCQRISESGLGSCEVAALLLFTIGVLGYWNPTRRFEWLMPKESSNDGRAQAAPRHFQLPKFVVSSATLDSPSSSSERST